MSATSCGGNYFSAGSCSCGEYTGVVCVCGERFYKEAHFNTHKRLSKTGTHKIKERWENGVMRCEK